MNARLLSAALAVLLIGCDIPGLGPDPRIALREADGKAIGAACRHALRGIEDCYALNEKALKTAVFEGWKEMDQYMRENKIEGIAPKEAKMQEPPEEIIEEKRSTSPARDKVAATARSRSDMSLTSQKAIEKTTAKAPAY